MSIQEHLNKIRNAIYGREVRESIAKGIETAYDDASENGNANMEVKIARGTHPNLRSRLEEVDNKQQQTTAQLAQKINQGTGSVRPSDLSQEVKEQMTGGSVAVVGEKAISNVNIQKDAVSPFNIGFLEKKILKGRKIKNDLGITQPGEVLGIGSAKEGVTSHVYSIPNNSFISINNIPGGNRFRVGVMNINIVNYDELRNYETLVDRIIISDDDKSSVEFYNKIGADLIVYSSNVNQLGEPLVEVVDELTPQVPINFSDQKISPTDTNFLKVEESEPLDLNEYRYVFIAYDDGVASYERGEVVYTKYLFIEPHQTYNIEVVGGINERFRVGVQNNRTIEYGDRVDRIISVDNNTKSISFDNDEFGKLLVIYLGTPETGSIDPKVTVTKSLVTPTFSINDEFPKKDHTYGLKASAIQDTAKGSLFEEKEIYPSLFGVKMTNYRTKEKQYNTHPTPIGWLYHTHETPSRILYADGKPDNLEYLFTWKSELAFEGRSPEWYSPFITKNGDIVFVFRGEQLGVSYRGSDGRQNPIVYPAGDYENPILVDLGDRLKPTAWLQNSGADYIYNQDSFIFAEYTRVHHDTCNVWKVSEPITDPNNWRVVKTFELSGYEQTGFKHAHTVNFDPWSERIYLTTGDDDSAAAIYESSDYGETWNMVLGDIPEAEKYCRLINFVFTENNVYWATDSGLPDKHFLFEVDRDANGVPDFTNIKELYKFPNYASWQATYVTAYIEEPNGLLFLNRTDMGGVDEPLDVYFWSFETNSMHIIASIDKVREKSHHGFRSQATNWYQSPSDGRIVCGFDFYKNNNDLLGNPYGANNNMICNLALEVVRV